MNKTRTCDPASIDVQRRSLLVEKRGTPVAVLISISEYVKLAAPEPEVLKVIGRESVESGKSGLRSSDIERAIKMSRAAKRKQ